MHESGGCDGDTEVAIAGVPDNLEEKDDCTKETVLAARLLGAIGNKDTQNMIHLLHVACGNADRTAGVLTVLVATLVSQRTALLSSDMMRHRMN